MSPYVYKVTHRETKQFYIGMRSANKVDASEDLGVFYFTSSKFVKNNFDKFDIEIIGRYDTWEDAFSVENKTIEHNWGNPLLINKHYQKDVSKFSMTGYKRPDVADMNKRTKSKPKEFREYECTCCRDTFFKEEFVHHHRQLTPFCCKSCANIYTGKSTAHKLAGKTIVGRTAWNKGKPSNHSADNAKKGAEKLSKKCTGRKRKYLPDGSWTWEYSSGCLD